MHEGAEPPLPHFVGENCGDVVVGVARVNDERQAELASERDLPAKDALSDIARGAVVMIVEAGFADADAFGVLGEFANCGEVLRPLACRLMRMRADGEKDAVVALGDFRDLRRPSRFACRW